MNLPHLCPRCRLALLPASCNDLCPTCIAVVFEQSGKRLLETIKTCEQLDNPEPDGLA